MRVDRDTDEHYVDHVQLKRATVLRFAGSALAVLALVFVVGELVKANSALPQLTSLLVLAMAVGALANVVAVLLGSIVWRRFLLEHDPRTTLTVKQAFAICGSAQIAKYLPGNIFQFVGRTTLAARYGIAVPVVALSVLVETAFVVATSVTLAAMVFASRIQTLVPSLSPTWVRWAVLLVALLVAVGAVLWHTVRARVVATVTSLAAMLSWRGALTAVACDVLTFVGVGAALYVTARCAWPDTEILTLAQAIGGFALAWVLGFVTPGAPGGVGVREGVFVALLGSAAGGGAVVGAAAMLVVLSRVQSIAGDVVTFVVARALIQKDPNSARV